MQPDVWTMSTGVTMRGLSDYGDCRGVSILNLSELVKYKTAIRPKKI